MGLDMGIRLKKRYDLLPWWFKKMVVFPNGWEVKEYSYKEEDEAYGIDICYWRNEWELLREICLTVGVKSNPDTIAEMTIDHVKMVRTRLKYYLAHPNEWDEIGHWTYEECSERLKCFKRNLFWLMLYMRLHPEVKVVFYASY